MDNETGIKYTMRRRRRPPALYQQRERNFPASAIHTALLLYRRSMTVNLPVPYSQAIMSLRHHLLFPVLLLWALFLPLSATGKTEQAVTIKELTATTSATHLITFATLENSFSEEMIDTLHSGIPLRFSFFIELHKISENRPDEQISTINFQHVMSFDTLKESYRVTLEEANNKVLTFRSLQEAQKVINEVNGVRVIELSQLPPDNSYRLQIRAELYQKTLPLGLQSLAPFLSWWDTHTDWHTIEFEY